MAISKNATVLEQSKNMYSLSDPNIVYWKDWAKKFIECCLELGWEVECGPGTSLGAVMFGTDRTAGESAYYIPTPRSSAWDCDWTQADGIVKEWQVDDTYNDYPKYTGWFKNFETWPTNANNYGIDEETGRFDFIVYTGKGENNEQIGFRIKYPICSIGYSYGGNLQSSYAINYIYGVPAVSDAASRLLALLAAPLVGIANTISTLHCAGTAVAISLSVCTFNLSFSTAIFT